MVRISLGFNLLTFRVQEVNCRTIPTPGGELSKQFSGEGGSGTKVSLSSKFGGMSQAVVSSRISSVETKVWHFCIVAELTVQ